MSRLSPHSFLMGLRTRRMTSTSVFPPTEDLVTLPAPELTGPPDGMELPQTEKKATALSKIKRFFSDRVFKAKTEANKPQTTPKTSWMARYKAIKSKAKSTDGQAQDPVEEAATGTVTAGIENKNKADE